MKTQRAVLPLAFLSAAFMLGCQDQGSGPVGPEDLGPQFHAAHPECEAHNKDDPGCNGGGGADTYQVVIFIGGGEVGRFPGVADARTGVLTEANGRVYIDLSGVGIPEPCTQPSDLFRGLFGISTDETGVHTRYYAIRLAGEELVKVEYDFRFGPSHEGEWLDADGLPTTDNGLGVNTLSGEKVKIRLGPGAGREKTTGCQAQIFDLSWSIVVTRS